MTALRFVNRRVAPRLAVVAALFAPVDIAADSEVDRKSRQQRGGFVGVVGQWSVVEDEGPAFKVDGANWSGQTEKAHLDSVGKSLFPSVGEPFMANGSAPGAFPLAVWRDVPAFSNGTIRVQFKLIAGRSDHTAGIVFGLQPSGEYYFMRYNTLEGNAAVWRFSNGRRAKLTTGAATAQLPMNTWHELTLVVSGTKVTGSVNGSALTVEYTLRAPVSGRIGLWTKRDAVTAFKNLRVTQ